MVGLILRINHKENFTYTVNSLQVTSASGSGSVLILHPLLTVYVAAVSLQTTFFSLTREAGTEEERVGGIADPVIREN